MITIACCLWDANEQSFAFSRDYTEADVDRLHRAFKRNLTVPFRTVCFTERPRKFEEDIWQERLSANEPGYGAMIEPFKLDEPMILCGLDTIVVGNCDDMARYCMEAATLALPKDPFYPEKTCNGVALVPRGHAWVWREFPGGNDMEWTRSLPCALIDRIFPRQVVSYKGHVQHYGLEAENRIVMLHGWPKAGQLTHLDWVREHYLGEMEPA